MNNYLIAYGILNSLLALVCFMVSIIDGPHYQALDYGLLVVWLFPGGIIGRMLGIVLFHPPRTWALLQWYNRKLDNVKCCKVNIKRNKYE
jgi:hypothetical protein